MTNRSRPSGRLATAVLALALALPALLGTPAAAAEGDLPGLGYSGPLPPQDSLHRSLAELSGTTAVFVTLRGSSALDVATSTGPGAAVDARVAQIDDTAADVADQVSDADTDTSVLYVSRYTVPGVALLADSAALRTLGDDPDVVAVHPIVLRDAELPPRTDGPGGATADVGTQALDAWRATGATGRDVHVAVIDTGLDYTHADFGGPGTAAAYAQALATTGPPDPALYDPDKYLGGHDFAGATYDADPSAPAGHDPVPVPDENPVDGPGGGHGTHVAGTAVGYGVLADGSTSTADPATLDPTDLPSWSIGPGAAPGAGVYALKVFGDGGGRTALVGAALDWVGAAVAAGTRIDVVNLSLGSDFGAPDDPDSAKVQALMDVGVLPVLAAGNAGDITDVAGAPGSAARSLAVAATASSGELGRDDPASTDTAAPFTSRGLHGSYDDVVKPDVAAPGVGIVSAGRGTGTGSSTLDGTSMAAPLVAGVAALVVQTHPDWTPDQVKAGIMNTAAHDVTTDGPDPVPFGPGRVGTGRVDALGAVVDDVLVASVDNPGLVTASFGVVEVGAEPVEQTRTLRVTNTGDVERSFDLGYLPRTVMPGVGYALDRSSVTVPAGGSASFTVTMSIPDPTALRRSLDPTMSADLGGAARQFVADASGVVTLDPTGSATQPPLRVAVFAAPEPVSATQGSDVSFEGGAADGAMTITGRGLDQGSGRERIASLAVPLQLGTTDPDDSFPAGDPVATLESADLLAVGASSTAPQLADPSQGVLSFGLLVDGDWNRLSPYTVPTVQIDVDGDGRVDYLTTYEVDARRDTVAAVTYEASSGRERDRRPVDGFGAEVDTRQFDTDVLVLPVSLAALGFTRGASATTISYRVVTQSVFAVGRDEQPADLVVDETAAATFDVFAPAVWFGSTGATGAGSGVFADAAGTLPVHRTGGVTTAGDGVAVLLLHLHGADGERGQVLSVLESGAAATPSPVAAGGGADGAGAMPTGAAPPAAAQAVQGSASAAPPGGLARTGAELAPWVVGGVVLVALGAGLVRRARRRPGTAEG